MSTQTQTIALALAALANLPGPRATADAINVLLESLASDKDNNWTAGTTAYEFADGSILTVCGPHYEIVAYA